MVLSVGVIVSLACVWDCAHKSAVSPPHGEDGKMMDPTHFLGVPLNTFERTQCTPPEPDPSWRGVVIQAPRRVSFKRGARIGESKAFAAIPICGLYVLAVSWPLEEDAILLVAKDIRTERSFSGPIVRLNPGPEAPHPGRPPLRKEDVARLASGRYFNPNLADFVKLPEEPGIYQVYAEVRGHRSNVVTIEIVE